MTNQSSAIWPKLDKPARVVGTFGAGVSSELVVAAAQRYFESTEEERKRTPQQRREDERSRRLAWDMINSEPDAESEGVEYIDTLIFKLECFIDHATGGKLSKSSWALETLKAAHDEHVRAVVDEMLRDAGVNIDKAKLPDSPPPT